MTEWVLLIPPGCKVETSETAAVDVPTLLTREQIMALAEAAATMKLAGIPVEVGDLLRRHVRPDLSEPLFDAAPYEAAPPPARAPEWPCSCGRIYADELKLRRHVAEYPSHDLKYIPPEHRVDA